MKGEKIKEKKRKKIMEGDNANIKDSNNMGTSQLFT